MIYLESADELKVLVLKFTASGYCPNPPFQRKASLTSESAAPSPKVALQQSPAKCALTFFYASHYYNYMMSRLANHIIGF